MWVGVFKQFHATDVMTDSDPRIDLMKRWYQENPAIMAQAGLTASLDSLGNEHLGEKNRRKKNKNKLLTGGHGSYVPMYPQMHPTHLAPHQLHPAHLTPHYHVNGRSTQPTPKKTFDVLHPKLVSKLESYKSTFDSDRIRLVSAVAAIDSAVKPKAVTALNHILGFYDGTSSGVADDTKLENIIKYINLEVLSYAKHTLTINSISHPEIKEVDFFNIPETFQRVWASAVLTEELLSIVDKHLRAMYTAAEIKEKAYISHLKQISVKLNHKLSDVKVVLRELKRLPKHVTATKSPRTITTFSGVVKTIDSEFVNPYGL